MTKAELEDLKKWISSLSGDERDGAMDALNRIMAGRGGGEGGSGMPLPPEIEVDPDLDEPEDDPIDADDVDDSEIDDPENLLKGSKDDSSDSPSDTDSDDKKTGDGDSDSGEDTDAKPTDGEDGKEDSGEESEEESVDDIDDSIGSELTKDAVEEENRKSEIFRRKVDAARTIKQLSKAIEEAEKDPSKGDPKELEDLKNKLTEVLEGLKDDPDKVDDMSAKEFNELINKALDAIDKAGVHISRITDMPSRLKKIHDDNEDGFSNDELDDEDNANIAADPEYQKMKAREAENDRIRKELADSKVRAFDGNIESFKADIKRAISDQISEMIEVEEETYAKVNRHHEDDDIAAPGIRIEDIPDYKKPSIDVYFDQSGSWGAREVDRGMAALKEILDLEKEDLIKINIWYFSAILSQNQAAARSRGEYECWDLVINNINAAPKTKNVIIMSDTDLRIDWGAPGCHGCINGPGTSVEGCVWYLWKNGDRVPEARTKLKGRRGTFEYEV